MINALNTTSLGIKYHHRVRLKLDILAVFFKQNKDGPIKTTHTHIVCCISICFVKGFFVRVLWRVSKFFWD